MTWASRQRSVVIVGNGVVGASLAWELARRPDISVTVLDRDPPGTTRGSTVYAPGFVGVFNESPVLTALARESVRVYEEACPAPGFVRAGGLEVAYTAAGWFALERRIAAARRAGLPAEPLDPAQAVAAVPELVDPDRCVGAAYFAADAVAHPPTLLAALRDRAAEAGARFAHEGPVLCVELRDGRAVGVRTASGHRPADDVVIAAGVWSPAVAATAGIRLPLTPVAHPYVYGPARPRQSALRPFVRWPERHVYGRDHGDRLGIGTYEHMPQPVAGPELGADARRPWLGDVFDRPVGEALNLLPPQHRFAPEERVNGVFAVTADNLPLLGPAGAVPGLWIATALWITHAAGAARWLATLMTGGAPPAGIEELRPDRFAGLPPDDVTARALASYCDIYAQRPASPVT